MIDPRFYESLGPIRLADLAELAGARLVRADDADVLITGVAPLDAGGPGLVGFLESATMLPRLRDSRLDACFVREADVGDAGTSGPRLIAVDRPNHAFTKACRALIRLRLDDFGETGVHPSAHLGEDVLVSSGAKIAQGVKIGDRTRIGPNAVVRAGVVIGPDSDIGPGAVIGCAVLGARVRIHANAVIGESGYGLAPSAGQLIERPHVGRVMIADDVRIGACTTVDRGMFVDTTIGESTKIDNLVQIAHNVQVGKACVIAGCTGISGSAIIEDGAMLGGSVGITDHVRVGARARLAGATLVMRDVPPGEAWSGAPARPIRQFFRELVALEKLAKRRDNS